MRARQQKYDEAAIAFKRVAELDPANAQVHYQLFLIYRRAGNREMAERELQIFQKMERDAKAQGTAPPQ